MHTSPMTPIDAHVAAPGRLWSHLLRRALPALLLPLLPACFAASLSAQTIPAADVVQTRTVVPAINGNAGHVAANNLGDVFYVSQTDNVAYWLPRGKTTPVSLVTGLSGARSVYVSPQNNVFISSNYSGRVIEVPYANGTYTANTTDSANIASCTASPTAPCLAFNNGAGATGYYLQASDLGFDQLGNSGAGPDAYVIDERDNVCNQSSTATTCNTILKFTPGTAGAYTASVVVTGLPQTNNGQIAVGPAGDVYYADGTYVYYVAAGASTYTLIGNGLVGPTGVTTDVYGNLFITDSGSGAGVIYEMPALNGVAQPSKQFVYLNLYTANGIGIDGLGDVFYTGYNNTTMSTTLMQAMVNTFNLGTGALNKPVSATGSTLTVQFTGAATLGTVALSSAASGFSYTPGTCAAATAYAALGSCTVTVNYTPNAVGLQTAAINLTSSTGANLATIDLSGVGLGAAQTSDPGTSVTLGSGLMTPQGIAVDSAGNVYIADPAQNAVLLYPAGSTTGTKLGSGLVGPTSVALDNAGNLYIADSGNGRVVEVPNVKGTLTSSAQAVIATGFPTRSAANALTQKKLGTSLGVATDQNNNLYIADANNGTVLRLGTIAGIPNTSLTTQLGYNVNTGISQFIAPIAVATDSTGNVFIADTTKNTVTEITYFGGQSVNIGGGYLHPSGVAADASGSVYIADAGNGRLLKVPYESPIFNTNDQYTVGGAIIAPYGVALDSAANLYVVDSADAAAFELNRLQGTLALGRANIQTSTSQSNANIGDAGNQNLNLGNPDYVATGNTSVFSVTSPAGNGCANSIALTPGTSCVLGAVFSPAVIGNFAENLAFTSNAVNTAAPSLMITGVGLNQATTMTVLAQTAPAGTAMFGQAVTITATITSTKAGTPSSTVTFFVDGNKQPKASTVGASGTATIMLTGLTGGKHTIGASYSGDTNFAPSAANTITITVAQAPSTTALVSSGDDHNPDSANPGTPVGFTATVTPSAATVPTGSVVFSLGSSVLGSSPVLPVAPSVPGGPTLYQASFTLTTLPLGTDNVLATYSGDINYSTSANTLPVIVTPGIFTITPHTANVSVVSGGYVTVPLTATSLSGFQGFVGVTCSGLPANSVCGFSPNGFVLQVSNLITAAVYQANPVAGMPPILITPATYGSQALGVTIFTGVGQGSPEPPAGGVGALRIPGFAHPVPLGFAFLLLSPLALVLRRRTAGRIRTALQLFTLTLLLAGSVTTFSGCSSGSNLNAPTPKGTYTVLVTAAATYGASATATDPAPTTFGPGCVYTPSTATVPTCTVTTAVTLVVQ